MKAVVAAFNQEKALVGAFSVITNLRMELFEALVKTQTRPSDVCSAESGAGITRHVAIIGRGGASYSAQLPPGILIMNRHVADTGVR